MALDPVTTGIILKAVSAITSKLAITSINNAIKKHQETKAAAQALEKLDARAAEAIREIIMNTDPDADFSDLIEELEKLEQKAGRSSKKSETAKKMAKPKKIAGKKKAKKAAKKKAAKKKAAKKAVKKKAAKKKARKKK
jgi:outer membrane biosynthesis protein TonB